MIHTDKRMQTHWAETRDFIKENWSKFSDSDLDAIDANYDKFLTCLRNEYGLDPAIEAKALSTLQRFFNSKDA